MRRSNIYAARHSLNDSRASPAWRFVRLPGQARQIAAAYSGLTSGLPRVLQGLSNARPYLLTPRRKRSTATRTEGRSSTSPHAAGADPEAQRKRNSMWIGGSAHAPAEGVPSLANRRAGRIDRLRSTMARMWPHCCSCTATVSCYRWPTERRLPPGRNVERTEPFTPVISPVIFATNSGNLPVFGLFSFTPRI